MATREVARIYQFITNNHASLHLWGMENFLNHQKVPKYYEHNCLQTFILLFMSLLTALIVKTVIFWLKFTLPFLKNVLD